MRTLIVYESMYGNTRETATEIAEALADFGEVTVVAVGAVTSELVASADFLVVGGPTHIHGLSTGRTRGLARDATMKEGSELVFDADAEGPGLREWLETLGDVANTPAAAFDTRVDAPAVFTGRASRAIARRLRQRHFRVIAKPESFLVDKETHLLAGEAHRAREWGFSLGRAIQAPPTEQDQRPAAAT
jgi:hypothetical protein